MVDLFIHRYKWFASDVIKVRKSKQLLYKGGLCPIQTVEEVKCLHTDINIHFSSNI